MSDEQPAKLDTVLVVGTGLVGTSVGLALRRRGVTVWLQDADPATLRESVQRGAGDVATPETTADLCVIAVPPAVTPVTLRRCQRAGRARTYTDTASVKADVLRRCRELGCDLSTYVGGHPMAGGERPGPAAARGDLFGGRPWVLTPVADTGQDTVAAARALLELCGAVPVLAGPEEHDLAVATVSHAPHLVASLLAGRLGDADDVALQLTGQGLRDTVRVAGGPAELWADILAANAAPVRDTLEGLAADLARAVRALNGLPGAAGSSGWTGKEQADDPRAVLAEMLERGRRGHARLPGKHGAEGEFAVVAVVVDDRPGRLARLFADVGEAGYNVEDVTIDHAAGQPQGLVHLAVKPEVVADVVTLLTDLGWSARAA